MAQWFVMYTKPRMETVAEDNLQRQHYRVFFPRALVRKRRPSQGAVEIVEPLFPRYLFVHLQQGVDDFSKLRSTKGCVDLVKFGGRPTPVPTELVDLIAQHASDQGVLNLLANQELEIGAKVRVAEGPFEGLVGTIAKQKSADRVLVLLNVLGAERSVEVPSVTLEKSSQ
ncbi:transcriptional activator RfaH [Limnobacter sp.]|uniref:transcriptional activator RfaH n=1 Tax=Limnobacter sp. TaxID=2003368 RepID=UPI003518DCD5